MENRHILPLGWDCYYQGKSMEELRHSLLCKTLELETTRLAAHEEIMRREEELKQMKDLLNRAIGERDEANDKYQRVLLLLQQQQKQEQELLNHGHQNPEIVHEEEGKSGDSNTGISSSECEGSIVSGSPVQLLEAEGRLPEKGKLLQAVMKAGPLLQTLLLAGPLPQWRHPPPPLDSLDIPPVVIPIDNTTTTTTTCENDNKYQRIILH
ncbi:uncharacterized protein LOC143883422 [Tasmannia lanceolata]|uniref:uncharacterized protein LOC143883422 n=1 Tax=Tasmannia lanceolata TaxID=3420 RepID=UPI004063C086